MEQEGTPLVLCGIAQPQYMMDYVTTRYPQAELMAFADHHHYTPADIDAIMERSRHFDFVLTTEKDIQRLRATTLVERLTAVNKRLIALPIRVKFYTPQETFDRQILNYVHENRHK